MKQYFLFVAMVFHSLLVCGQYRMVYDSSFSNDGFVPISLKRTTNKQGLYLQSDGKIIGVCKYEIAWNNTKFRMFRLNSNGSLDNSYATNGIFIGQTNFSSNVNPVGCMLSNDELIITGSGVNTPFNRALTIHKFLKDGRLDSTFAVNGSVNIKNTNHDFFAIDIALYKDSSLLVLYGSNYEDADTIYNQVYLSKISLDGKLDSLFGQNGQLDLYDPNFNHAKKLSISVDGSIYILGEKLYGDNIRPVIRLNPDFTRDTSFFHVIGNNEYRVETILTDEDGKLIIAASKNKSGYGLWRIMPNGVPDTSFGKNGFMGENLHIGAGYVSRLIEQPDGKLLISFDQGAVAIRVTPNGRQDYSFDLDGMAAPFYSGGDLISYVFFSSGMLLQPDGKIVFMTDDEMQFLHIVRIVASY